MKHIFKWPLDKLEYLWQSELKIKTTTLSIEDISKEDLEKISKWYSIAYVDWELELTDTSDIELNIKKQECRSKILSKYKEHDQRNIMLSGTEEELNTMRTYIQAVLKEYRDNWKDADFSDIT